MLDNDALIYNLLLVIIVLIGFGVLFGKKPTAVLKFLFSPIIWLFGGIFKAGVVVLIGVLAIYFVAGGNINSVVDLASSFFKSENTAPIPVPSPSPKPPVVSQPASLQFSYPVGEMDSRGLRKGEGWIVTQDFADEIDPVSSYYRGKHLGEDWQLFGREDVECKKPNCRGFDKEPVYAIGAGSVLNASQSDPFGYVIIIKHPLPKTELPFVTSLYGHITPYGNIQMGQEVKQGELIGYVARSNWNGCSAGCNFTAPGCKPRAHLQNTGHICRSWPIHLHFELRTPTGGIVPGFGYPVPMTNLSPYDMGFLNPTDVGSDPRNNGNGWIDAYE